MNEDRIRSCLYTIQDNLQALNSEMNRDNPYPAYLLEKAKPILNDIQVIIEQCERVML